MKTNAPHYAKGLPFRLGESLPAAADGDAVDFAAAEMYLLGLAHFRGQGVEQSLEQARWLQREAARRGVVEAQFELSLLLSQGIGGKVDRAGARRWEFKAADAGHPRACLNRAVRATRRRPPNFVEALLWYERAAEAGSAEAAARLCRMYLAGQGIARDDAAAEVWFARAAALGYDWTLDGAAEP